MKTILKNLFFAGFVISIGLLLIGAQPSFAKGTAYQQWEERHAEREARWAELAVQKPTVYRDYIRDSVLGNDANSLGQKIIVTAFKNGVKLVEADGSQTTLEQINARLKANFDACWPNCTGTLTAMPIADGKYYTTILYMPVGVSNNVACIGWGCLILGQSGGAGNGAGGNGAGAGNGNGGGGGAGGGGGGGNGLLGTPLPSDQPLISQFEITNFTKRTDPNGTIFYFILAPQMQAGYKANIAWSVSGSQFCTAACTYTDKAGTHLPDGPGQANDCQWRGNLSSSTGNFKVQPKWQGSVHYTLTCVNGTLSDTKSFDAGIKQFSWQEAIMFEVVRQHLNVGTFNEEI